MFICNVKVNSKLCFKIIMIVMALIVLGIFILSLYKLFGQQQQPTSNLNEGMRHSDVTEILPNNYTNILKAVHDDLESYLGKQIKFSGYIYKVFDFKENQFVLARDMLIDSQSYVVGFLCEYDKIRDFADSSWVEIIGSISKGKYHNHIVPIIKIHSLNEIEKPSDAFVLPPSDTYIPTSAVL